MRGSARALVLDAPRRLELRTYATAYRAALDLLASGRYPFESLPRRCVGLDGAADLLATMGGEGDEVPPVHGVLRP